MCIPSEVLLQHSEKRMEVFVIAMLDLADYGLQYGPLAYYQACFHRAHGYLRVMAEVGVIDYDAFYQAMDWASSLLETHENTGE